MIILSFRYLSDDHFWFTFFHEIGHLLLHKEDLTFIDGEELISSKMGRGKQMRFPSGCLSRKSVAKN